MNLEKKFLKTFSLSGAYYLKDNVDQKTLEEISEVILYAERRGFSSFTMYIKSSGGDVASSLKIYSVIEASPIHTRGIIMGDASSSSLLILQAFDERLMHRYSTAFIHAVESRRFVYDNGGGIGMRNQKIVEGILQQKTKIKDLEKIMNGYGKEFFDNELLEVGLIDGFIEKR